MRIKNLHIMDFGVLRNQSMLGIKGGIVVIAGFNRAGKTTFLNVLRHLFYGIKRSAQLPPATQEYRMEADLALEEGQEVSIRLTGFSQPEIFLAGGEKASNLVICGDIDDFTYRRLFTISLDELCNLPEGISGQEATNRLQSVLLGAGFADAAAIPHLCAEVRKEAEAIGGKKGSPGVKLFKESNETIQNGVKMLKEAWAQVGEYEETRRALEEIEQEINSLEEAKAEAEADLIILDFIEQCFPDYQELQSIEAGLKDPKARELSAGFSLANLEKARRLQEEHALALAEYKKALIHIEGVLGPHLRQYRQLLERQQEIKEAYRQSAVVRQLLQQLKAGAERLEREEAGIKLDMAETNQHWTDFAEVKAINSDHLHMSEVSRTITEYRDLQDQVKEEERILEEVKREEETTGQLLQALSTFETGKALFRFYLLACSFAVGGYLLSLVQAWLGLFLGMAGIIASGVYLIFRFIQEKEGRERQRQLRVELNRKVKLCAVQGEKVKQKAELLAKASQNLCTYQQILGLPREKNVPELILEYFKRVQELKRRISIWGGEAENLQKMEESVRAELESLAGLARALGYLPELPGDCIAVADRVLDSCEEITSHLEVAGEFRLCEQRLLSLGQEILQLLKADNGEGQLRSLEVQRSLKSPQTGQVLSSLSALSFEELVEASEAMLDTLETLIRKGEKLQQIREQTAKEESLKRRIGQCFSTRVKEAFYKRKQIQEGTPDPVSVLSAACADFISGTDVHRRYVETEERIAFFGKDLDELKKKQNNMENKLENLATSEKLAEAQKVIDKARGRLEPLARKYALYKVAALIFEELHQAFLEKTKGELLQAAGSVFARLTNSSYQQILPADDLLTPDFKVVTLEGKEVESTAFLSRGTKEQLFLAVRFSRIQRLRPALPVILDDSLVNFDVKHTRQAINLLLELSRTHQIFVLTCHPEIIEYLVELDRTVQCWQIAGGTITPAESGGLIKYLRGETLDLL